MFVFQNENNINGIQLPKEIKDVKVVTNNDIVSYTLEDREVSIDCKNHTMCIKVQGQFIYCIIEKNAIISDAELLRILSLDFAFIFTCVSWINFKDKITLKNQNNDLVIDSNEIKKLYIKNDNSNFAIVFYEDDLYTIEFNKKQYFIQDQYDLVLGIMETIINDEIIINKIKMFENTNLEQKNIAKVGKITVPIMNNNKINTIIGENIVNYCYVEKADQKIDIEINVEKMEINLKILHGSHDICYVFQLKNINRITFTHILMLLSFNYDHILHSSIFDFTKQITLINDNSKLIINPGKYKILHIKLPQKECCMLNSSLLIEYQNNQYFIRNVINKKSVLIELNTIDESNINELINKVN